jgi:hypothetical protein
MQNHADGEFGEFHPAASASPEKSSSRMIVYHVDVRRRRMLVAAPTEPAPSRIRRHEIT